ncbi:hypothetical protein MMC31_001667 [Peltigera leucophlebia]|nr:hypothetical protein [Peltigera leucophlebia]
MLSPSSKVISLLCMTVSCIADSTWGLQTDDSSSSSLAPESYGLANFPLANIEEDGANLEIPNPNVQLQQLEQSKSSHGCSSYSNMDTNRSNRKLRLRREGTACVWNQQTGSDAIPSSSDGVVPLKTGAYIKGGSLSDKWGVCGTGLSMVANSIPVCTPVNLADTTDEAITSLREGPYTDLLMARLCTVPSWLLQFETLQQNHSASTWE